MPIADGQLACVSEDDASLSWVMSLHQRVSGLHTHTLTAAVAAV